MMRKMVLGKRNGETLPFFAIITIGFVVILLMVFLQWQGVLFTADDAKDSVTVSAQAVCLHDPVASSLFLEKEDVIFYSGSNEESMSYYVDTERITRVACENALQKFENLLERNLSPNYQYYEIEKFEMRNVLNGMVYTYDGITGISSSFNATDEESSLNVVVKVVRDTFFGEIVLPVKEVVFLREK